MLNQGKRDVAEVVALMLEQAGMKNLDVTDDAFTPPNDATFDEAAAAFARHVGSHPVATDYAMYAAFIGTPETGPRAVECVMVDKSGGIVFAERQTNEDAAFRGAAPVSPMTCCVFLCDRVRAWLKIPASARDDSGTGKWARALNETMPGPDAAGRRAMTQRRETLKKAGRRATVAIYPVRVSNDKVAAAEAARLAERLNGDALLTARAVESDWRIAVGPWRNEQKALWQLADGFAAEIRRNPPDADYALVAEYITQGRRMYAVHFVVCDREGRIVIADFQNQHHPDFQNIEPKSRDDCGRVVARRIMGYLK
jgi:hypothetical protein